MAISVEFGPGIKFTAASRSRNRSGVTQRRRRDQFVFHHGDMGGRPAEGRGPQAEEDECQFAQARPRAALGRFRPGGR